VLGAAAALLRACHPEPTAAVTGAAAALALSTGRDARGVLAVTAAVLAGQLSIGWNNDWTDAERDRRTARADKPVVTGGVSARAVGAASLVAAALCVPLSLLHGWLAGSLHLGAVAAGWAYNRPLKSTPLSVLPYAVAFALLPSFVVLGLPGGPPPPVWLVAAGGMLGAGAHFANVLPDLSDDAATGVRGLPHRLGATASRAAAALLLVGASLALALGPPGPPSVFGLAALGVAGVALAVGLVPARAGSRTPFRAVLVVAVVDVALLLASGEQLR